MNNQTEKLPNLGAVYRIWQELIDNDLLPLWSEHDEHELLKRHPILGRRAVNYLYQLIQRPFDPNYKSLYDITPNNDAEPDAKIRKDSVCEVIGEAMHQSLDGWSDGEKVVIELFLMDLGAAANLTVEAYKNVEGSKT